jgi:hypothetical protein
VHASAVAYLAMVLFVPFSVAVFAVARPAAAAITVILVGSLLLPERVGFDLPGLPPVDKYGLSSFCALVGSALTAGRRLAAARPGRGVDLFVWILLLGMVGTSATNRDVLVYGPTVLPALTMYDALSNGARALFAWVVPFILGRALFRTDADLRLLAVSLVVAALLYSPLVLYEVRMSPQLHRMIYGFHQHDFIQTVREGGWRPMVFVYHGLVLATFVLAALLCGVGLRRARVPLPGGIPSGFAVFWLTVVLVLLKSAGALVYSLVLMPATLLLRARTLARIAQLLVAFVLAFPLLRALQLFPTAALVDLAAQWNQARASSLAFRFANEDALVAKAMERWLFGWGGFGRNRIYAEWGGDISVTDGFWIIQFGSGGAFGFVAVFGLLIGPVWMAARTVKRLRDGVAGTLLAVVTMVLAITVVDLLPNGLNTMVPLFMAGALAGIAQGIERQLAGGMS